jgi:hypothetical protein
MSRLFLRCALCGRQQADGLLSRGFWGHIELADNSVLRACPACKGTGDWEARLRASANGGASSTRYTGTSAPRLTR